MSAWFYLVAAGLLEVCWATGLKYTDGFSRPIPTVLTVAAIIASMWLLGLASKTMPIGTAYAVWVGIGATGAALLGSVVFREPLTAGRMVFLGLLVVSIVGLKLTAPPHDEAAPPAVLTAERG
jgi:quaternary ammonium compound-resistance protein SugE